MNYEVKLASAVQNGKLLRAARDNITTWLTDPKYGVYQKQLMGLVEAEDWNTLNDNFFQVLPFGTGGRRGTVGIGCNRINKVTIGDSAQGLANYLLITYKDAQAKGIVIAHDTRLTAHEFTEFVASVFAGNGFQVYLFNDFRSTPELSFAVRYLKTAAGVVVSASHNPKTDNGFKVYWQDGGQLVPPHDENLMQDVAKVDKIKELSYQDAVRNGQIRILKNDVDEAYIDAVVGESILPTRSAKIVYSPLHGTGTTNAYKVLQAAGFKNITVVEEQNSPDGNFPNIANSIPNPEIKAASDLVTQYAKKVGADIGITTDPDADRLGVVALGPSGEYQFLNGNQIAALIGYFVLSSLKVKSKLDDKSFIVKTIVTTDLLDAIANHFQVKCYNNILIGFKYVAELIRQKQDESREVFVFGGEESHGILKGSYTRDKDAAVAALMISELASQLKDDGQTLVDQLNDLYKMFGIYWETLLPVFYEGARGGEKMANIMTSLRNNPPTMLDNKDVLSVTDRLSGSIVDPKTGKQIGKNGGTKGDVMIFSLSENGRNRITVRPSGTEPKLKIYTQIYQSVTNNIETPELTFKKNALDKLAKQLTKSVVDYTEAL